MLMNALSRWWAGVSLRGKITGVTVLLLTGGVLFAGVSTTVLLRSYLIERLDQQLVSFDASDVAAEGPERQIDLARDASDYFVATYTPEGDLLYQNWAPNRDLAERPVLVPIDWRSAAELAGTVQVLRSNEDPPVIWHAVVTQLRGDVGEPAEAGVVMVALSTAPMDALMSRYAAIFFGSGVAVVLLGALITSALVRRTFAPLREVERTAEAIAGGDFSRRLAGDTPNTEVGRLNRSLNTMLNRFDRAFADRARTLEQMRRFIGDASHELRTPLVTVRGYAELYRMGALTNEQDVAQAMDRIEKEAVRMGLLVEDLLLLARLDETRPLERKPIDLVPIAEDAARDAMAQAPERSVRVVVEPSSSQIDAAEQPREEETAPERRPRRTAARAATRPPRSAIGTGPIALAGATLARLRRRQHEYEEAVTEPESVARPAADDLRGQAMVLADENKIRQVIANLLANALRFTPSGSPLELGVRVDRRASTASVSIIDHGEGIPAQIRDKIFERFWRADNSRTRETGGSGLGLAIVSAIVSAHRGRVSVVETPGGGATFVVTLPLLVHSEPTDVSTADAS